METLIQLLKKCLAESYALYLKAHNYHWNVEGPNFAEMHAFFGDFYEEIYETVDTMAEKIRMLGAYAPGSFSRFMEMSEIEDELSVPTSEQMLKNLQRDNDIIMKTLDMTYKFAEKEDKQALANYMAERLDAHEKHAWMLRSFING